MWDENQICSLFDSLMKGYPIGTFLFWQVEEKDLLDYSFHKFLYDVDLIEKDRRGSRITSKVDDRTIIAVLDGQQRITSLLVGLIGSYKSKIKAARKINGEFPKRYLAINLLHIVRDTKNDNYELSFLTEDEIKENDATHYWYKLSNIIEQRITKDTTADALEALNITDNIPTFLAAINMVQKIIDVIYSTDIISYYTAMNTDLSEAVEIFERINNNGKSIGGTDLMLSMASANSQEDMHIKIKDAITSISNAMDDDTGFVPNKDFIITSMLMAIGVAKVSSTCKDNYTSYVIDKITQEWDAVIDSITNAAIFIDSLGFNCRKLGKSFVYPIAYYFYKHVPSTSIEVYCDSSDANVQANRRNITQWIIRANVKKIFDYGTPATLQKIRNTMDASTGDEKNVFPLKALIADSTGDKSLVVSKDDVEDILNWQYGNLQILPLFTVILNETRQKYDVDHLWPQAKMSSEAKIKVAFKPLTTTPKQIEFYHKHYNLLPNLQLLRKTPNQEKSQEFFDKWLVTAYPEEGEKNTYISNCCIPTNISYEFNNFEEFYFARRELLKKRLYKFFDIMDITDNS